MYHGRFNNSHYEAGFKWGNLLYKHGKKISNNHTFVITEDRRKFVKECHNNFSVDLIRDILSGKYGFMCQYDRKLDADTVWSVIYDIRNSEIYRVEGNPKRKTFKKDPRLKFKV